MAKPNAKLKVYSTIFLVASAAALIFVRPMSLCGGMVAAFLVIGLLCMAISSAGTGHVLDNAVTYAVICILAVVAVILVSHLRRKTQEYERREIEKTRQLKVPGR